MINFLQIYYLTVRNIISRYRNYKIAIFWILFKPLIILTVLTFTFQFIIEMNFNTKVSYVFYILSGLIIWTNFSNNLNDISDSLLNNNMLIKSFYTNKNNIYLSYILLNLIELLVMTLILVLLLLIFEGLIIKFNLIYFLIALVVLQLINYSLGIIFSFLLAKLRELKHIINIILQLGIFVNPIAYSMNFVPENLKPFFYFNPLILPIELFRLSIGIIDEFDNKITLYSLITLVILGFTSSVLKKKYNLKINELV